MFKNILEFVGLYKDTRFYYLSLMLEDNQWVIHGLWPQSSKTNYPQFCKKVTFDPELLKPIEDELDKYWSSDRGGNDNFWEHEWKKHGSCFFSDINEFGYFNTTLELYEKVKKMGIIEEYRDGEKALIPFDLDLQLIKNV